MKAIPENVCVKPSQKISGAALWSVLWRAVVFFPLGLFLFALPVTILCSGVFLAAWSFTFTMLNQWWHALACAAGLPPLVFAWRCYARWSAEQPDADQGRGGYLL